MACSRAWPPPVSAWNDLAPIRSRIAVLDAMIGGGHACRPPEIFMPAAQYGVRDLRRKPVATIERPMHVGAQIAGGILQRQAVEIFGAWHRKLQVETLREPAREADMIGMEMRDDHRGEALTSQWSAQDRLPGRPAGVGAQARVEHRPAVSVLDQIDVHVIEPVRQRQAKPPDARCNFDEAAWRRWRRMWEFKGLWRVCSAASP